MCLKNGGKTLFRNFQDQNTYSIRQHEGQWFPHTQKKHDSLPRLDKKFGDPYYRKLQTILELDM